MTSLHLEGNRLTALPPEVTQLQALTSLDLSHNKLTRLPTELLSKVHYFEKFLTTGNPLERSAYQFTRSIEFPPGYVSSGTAILNHFGQVLRSKYKDKAGKVTIEQDGLKVTMNIETDTGEHLARIEETFEEFGMVLLGEMKPELLLDDRFDQMDLKNELRMHAMRVELKNEQLDFKLQVREEQLGEKRLELDRAYKAIAEISKRPAPQILVSTTASSASSSISSSSFNLSAQLAALTGTVRELIDEAPKGDEGRQELEAAADKLKELEAAKSPEEVKSHPAMSKLRRIVEDLGDDKSKLSKTVKGLKAGGRIAQDLAKKYNSIAKWCGLPVVPFVGS